MPHQGRAWLWRRKNSAAPPASVFPLPQCRRDHQGPCFSGAAFDPPCHMPLEYDLRLECGGRGCFRPQHHKIQGGNVRGWRMGLWSGLTQQWRRQRGRQLKSTREVRWQDCWEGSGRALLSNTPSDPFPLSFCIRFLLAHSDSPVCPQCASPRQGRKQGEAQLACTWRLRSRGRTQRSPLPSVSFKGMALKPLEADRLHPLAGAIGLFHR